MKSAVAIVLAVVMIGGSWAVREFVIDGDDEPGRTTSAVVVCVEELRSLCETLGDEGFTVSVEAAGTTADAWSTARDLPDVDAWIAPVPWPELVDARRVASGFEPAFSGVGDRIATSPLDLVVRSERGAVLAADCGLTVATLDWACVDDAAGQPWTAVGGDASWGSVKPGFTNPVSSSTGALVLAQAVTARVGNPDFGREIFDDPAFSDWFTRFARSVPAAPGAGSPLERFLAVPAAYDAVGDTAAAIEPTLAAADPERRRALTTGTPNPPATAQLVVAPIAGREGGASDVTSGVRDDAGRNALQDNGWTIADGEPGATGLPDGGTLQVIRQRWQEALR